MKKRRLGMVVVPGTIIPVRSMNVKYILEKMVRLVHRHNISGYQVHFQFALDRIYDGGVALPATNLRADANKASKRLFSCNRARF